jgi:hypothetical protein
MSQTAPPNLPTAAEAQAITDGLLGPGELSSLAQRGQSGRREPHWVVEGFRRMQAFSVVRAIDRGFYPESVTPLPPQLRTLLLSAYHEWRRQRPRGRGKPRLPSEDFLREALGPLTALGRVAWPALSCLAAADSVRRNAQLSAKAKDDALRHLWTSAHGFVAIYRQADVTGEHLLKLVRDVVRRVADKQGRDGKDVAADVVARLHERKKLDKLLEFQPKGTPSGFRRYYRKAILNEARDLPRPGGGPAPSTIRKLLNDPSTGLTSSSTAADWHRVLSDRRRRQKHQSGDPNALTLAEFNAEHGRNFRRHLEALIAERGHGPPRVGNKYRLDRDWQSALLARARARGVPS